MRDLIEFDIPPEGEHIEAVEMTSEEAKLVRDRVTVSETLDSGLLSNAFNRALVMADYGNFRYILIRVTPSR